jgi:hypothetical protein
LDGSTIDDAPPAGAFLHAKPPSLYEQVMGERFERLAPALREFHRLAGRVRLHGEVHVEAPRSAVARWLAMALGTPRREGAGPIRFELDAVSASETWTRRFAGSTMVSRMHRFGGRLVERLGPATLAFSLDELDGRLVMALASMRFCGLPCPRWLGPRIVAEETGVDRRLHFDVSAHVPVVGLVTRYRGWLDLASVERLG